MVKLKILLLIGFIVSVSNAINPDNVPTIRLNDGHLIPMFGLGTYLENNLDDVKKTVEVAIDLGYRHFDTAAIYKTEKHIGESLDVKIKAGTVKRGDLYITTKIWNDKHREDQVVPELRESLKRLGLDYVDLYLIHEPVSVDEFGKDNHIDFLDTWKGMEEAQRLGLTKSIGVSNFNETQLQRILDNAKVKPAVNQIEVHPNYTNRKLVTFCQEKGIAVVAYSPLGFIPSGRQSKGPKPKPQLDDPILTEMAHKYNKSTVQIIIRYLLDQNLIPIPKSVNPLRLEQNIDVFDFNLTPEERAKIDQFNLDKSVEEL